MKSESERSEDLKTLGVREDDIETIDVEQKKRDKCRVSFAVEQNSHFINKKVTNRILNVRE